MRTLTDSEIALHAWLGRLQGWFRGEAATLSTQFNAVYQNTITIQRGIPEHNNEDSRDSKSTL